MHPSFLHALLSPRCSLSICHSHPGTVLEAIELDVAKCSSVLVGDSARLGSAARMQVVPDAGQLVAPQDGLQRFRIRLGNATVDNFSQFVDKELLASFLLPTFHCHGPNKVAPTLGDGLGLEWVLFGPDVCESIGRKKHWKGTTKLKWGGLGASRVQVATTQRAVVHVT